MIESHPLLIRSRKPVEELLSGDYRSAFKGRGIEFEDVRPYEPGDEIRSMDWKVTARTGEPHVKRFIEERDLTVYFLIDISASVDFGTQGKTKRTACQELAALLGRAAMANHDRVGLLLFAEDVELHLSPRKGLNHLSLLLEHIEHHSAKSRTTHIQAALDAVFQFTRRRSILFLLSDFHDDRLGEELVMTSSKHELIALSLQDPRERRLPPAGLIQVRDAESGIRSWLDTSPRAIRERFFHRANHRRSQRHEQLTSAGVDVLELEVGDDYVAALHTFLQARLHG
ncbi:MAG: DUF58 domain-containing protein [Verrucomicrobiota bacterium]